MAAVRSFIALDLPPAVKRSLEDVSAHLSKTLDAVRWVKSENIHLTLKFLGDVQDQVHIHIEQRGSRMGARSLPRGDR